MAFNKSRIKRKLSKGKCQVTFRKMDGEVRKMLATLNGELIPEDLKPKVNKPEARDVVRAFDLEKNAWRSFHVSRVEAFTTRTS